jgi:hypothetical protein
MTTGTSFGRAAATTFGIATATMSGEVPAPAILRQCLVRRRADGVAFDRHQLDRRRQQALNVAE